MKISNKTTAVIALGALFGGGAAFAATNADAVHLALDSLLVASSKRSVVNAINANHKAPSTNAEARLGAPSTMTTPEIKGIIVGKGGVLNIYLAPNTGADNGVISLVPTLVKGKQKGKEAVKFACISPNIPDIAQAAPGCVYRADSAK
ncbi:MAG: hypothetical protein ABI132_03860 [Rhodanobacteraceae bacterium]